MSAPKLRHHDRRPVPAGAPVPDLPLDVQLTGTPYLDLVFSGLTATPQPGTEIRTRGLGSSPGGVANLAVAMRRLDLTVGLAGPFANDIYGTFLWHTLGEQEGVDLSASRRVDGWVTPVTVSLAYNRERSMITYEQPPPAPMAELLAQAPQARCFLTYIDNPQASWLPALRAAGTRVFADVGWDSSERWSPSVLDNLALVDVFMPNAAEAMAYTRTSSPQAALDVLTELVPVAVVKCGHAGAVAASRETGERVHEPAIAVEALDPTGAGDVFGAALVYGSLHNWSLAERLRFANLCAGLSVRYYGGSLSAPCWNEVAGWCRELDADPGVPAERKAAYQFLHEHYARTTRRVQCRRAAPTIDAACLAPQPSGG